MQGKDWLETLEMPGKFLGALTALIGILVLIPKLFRVLMSFYSGAKFTLEIKEHLENSRKEMLLEIENTRRQITEHLGRIDDGQLNLIEIRRHTLDADISCVWFVTDSHGQTEWTSDAWTKVTGMATEDARGSGWELGVAADELARVLTAWRLAVDHKRRYVDEFNLVHVINGRRTKVHVVANPIKRSDGTVLNYFGCARFDHDTALTFHAPEP